MAYKLEVQGTPGKELIALRVRHRDGAKKVYSAVVGEGETVESVCQDLFDEAAAYPNGAGIAYSAVHLPTLQPDSDGAGGG